MRDTRHPSGEPTAEFQRDLISHLPDPSRSSGSRRDAAMPAAIHLNCPRCGLTITPKASRLMVEHCPRCAAHSSVAVSLFASTLPTNELYAAGAIPGSDRFDAPPAAYRRR